MKPKLLLPSGVMAALFAAVVILGASAAAGYAEQHSGRRNQSQVQIHGFTFVSGKFGLSSGDSGYTSRSELASQNGTIQIDDVTAASSSFGEACRVWT